MCGCLLQPAHSGSTGPPAPGMRPAAAGLPFLSATAAEVFSLVLTPVSRAAVLYLRLPFISVSMKWRQLPASLPAGLAHGSVVTALHVWVKCCCHCGARGGGAAWWTR